LVSSKRFFKIVSSLLRPQDVALVANLIFSAFSSKKLRAIAAHPRDASDNLLASVRVRNSKRVFSPLEWG
jgi:hypothetical protein